MMRALYDTQKNIFEIYLGDDRLLIILFSYKDEKDFLDSCSIFNSFTTGLIQIQTFKSEKINITT